MSRTAHDRPPAHRGDPTPTTSVATESAASGALLEVIDLVKYFPVMGGFPRRAVGHIKAVDGISLLAGAG